MESFFSLLSVMFVCATIFGIAFVIVLALPDCRMREVVKKALIAVACVVYILSPIDIIPEIVLGPIGLLDDGAALMAAITSAREAYRLAT